MGANLNGFDADKVEPSKFEVIPEGEYVAVIVNSEEKSTASGSGKYVSLEIEIVDGEYKGRKLFDNLNLVNPNETAVTIAKQALASICLAVNIPRPSNTSQLHNLPLRISVKCEKRKDTGDLQNRIKKYTSASGVTHVKPVSSPGAAPSGDVPPWARPAS